MSSDIEWAWGKAEEHTRIAETLVSKAEEVERTVGIPGAPREKAIALATLATAHAAIGANYAAMAASRLPWWRRLRG